MSHRRITGIRIFLNPIEDKIWETVRAILTNSFSIYLGRTGGDFVERRLAGLERTCRLQPTIEQLEKFFRESRRIALSHGFQATMPIYKRASLKRSIALIGEHSWRGTILDVGCGENLLARLLVESKANITKVIGCDVTPPSQHGIAFPRVEFRLMNTHTRLPVASNSIDFVVMRFSMHHVHKSQQSALFRDVKRCLTQHGCAAMIEDTFGRSESDALCENVALHKFHACKRKLLCLAVLDACSAFLLDEKMSFPFAFRSLASWRSFAAKQGLFCTRVEYWGLPLFSIFQAPMGIIWFKRSQ